MNISIGNFTNSLDDYVQGNYENKKFVIKR